MNENQIKDASAGPAANATANRANQSTADAFSRAQAAVKNVSASQKPIENTQWKPK